MNHLIIILRHYWIQEFLFLTSTKETTPSARAQKLLKVLIERYIHEGIPVASKALALDSGMDLSPATIRNILADLEEQGLISSIHTSSGRVPTDKGYRFFVDTLVNFDASSKTLDSLTEIEHSTQSKQGLIKSASDALSGITKLASLISIPKQKQSYFTKIEFLRLSTDRVLAVLILDNYEVQNRVLYVNKEFSTEELSLCASYLNERLSGRLLSEIRKDLFADLTSMRTSISELMMKALQITEDSHSSKGTEILISGETNLMDIKELADVQKLKQMFDAFSQKRDLIHLLDKTIASPGVKIYIGKESGYEIFDECSVVTAPYKTADDSIGVLGVVGPTRMPYDKVVPIVDLTAKFISSALKSDNWPYISDYEWR